MAAPVVAVPVTEPSSEVTAQSAKASPVVVVKRLPAFAAAGAAVERARSAQTARLPHQVTEEMGLAVRLITSRQRGPVAGAAARTCLVQVVAAQAVAVVEMGQESAQQGP